MGNKVLKGLAMAAAVIFAAGASAQALHPERVYLSGTGIDDTRTWDFYCTHGQNSGKWKK